LKIRIFTGSQKRHEELIQALNNIQVALGVYSYRSFHKIPQPPDYSNELKKLADVSRDVQGAAELLARWLALQLPPEARKDVPLPDDWKKV